MGARSARAWALGGKERGIRSSLERATLGRLVFSTIEFRGIDSTNRPVLQENARAARSTTLHPARPGWTPADVRIRLPMQGHQAISLE